MTRSSLQVKLPSAPVFWRHIGDGFSEVPAVSVKILGVVLTLAIRMVSRLRQNEGPILARVFAVPLGILDADLNRL